MTTKSDTFVAIASKDLEQVGGGATRVTSRSNSGNDQMLQMLTQLTSSLGQQKQDPMSSMMPMMMMMMMGGGGGGGASAQAAPPPGPPPPPPAPQINVSINRGR